MHQSLPPLAALRVFEAAGRHLSFKKAAEELNVTPAAVGHQIRLLESYLGTQLFRRLNRRVLLTDAGQACLPEIREGFTHLRRALDRIRTHAHGETLTLSVEPSFAAKWLVQRLDSFTALHPDIDIRLDATSRLVDLVRENVDIGIRYGSGDYPTLRVDELMTEEVFPVCGPGLLEGRNALRTPDDLRNHTLLHEEWASASETWPSWALWLRAAGYAHIDATHGPRFTQASLAIEAAIEGHGVALGGSILVDDDLKAGRLVRPFASDLSDPIHFAYYLVSPPAVAESIRVERFRSWALAKAAGPKSKSSSV
ncbi:MAG: transcriptional regulator GcvA [Gammaproteobacteria bacterium]